MTIPRDLLAAAFPGQPRLVAEFENLSDLADGTAETLGQQVDATDAAAQASYVTLSANASLPNERVLTAGSGVTILIEDGKVTVSARVRANGTVLFQTQAASSTLLLPPTGTLATVSGEENLSNKTLNYPRLEAPTYADNLAAISGGLAVGDVYQTATGVVMVRY